MRRTGLLYLTLVAFVLLHNDFWLWQDGRMILSVPVGFLYHVFYCVVASALFYLFVRFAWPKHLQDDSGGAQEP